MSDTKKVKEFWDNRAKDKNLNDIDTTHPDIWQRWLEIKTVEQLLPNHERVIDIGCGSGYATRIFAPLVGNILGIDFSEAMIERCVGGKTQIPENARFQQSDVLQLSADEVGHFDAAVSMRCLINLIDWEAQKQALSNIASIVKKGGLFIFIEGLQDGREALNRLRVKMGLEEMPPVWNNVDFIEQQTREFLERDFVFEREIGFGSYDLVARVVHPLLVAPEQPRYEAQINEIAARAALNRPNDMTNSRMAVYCLRRK